MPDQPKRLFSALQPSGILTLGNYLGALRNFVAMQQDYTCYFAVANQHAITVPQEPAMLSQRTAELMALFLAIGLDRERCVLFVQSQVPEHAQLAWVLTCLTGMGELSRMTQFKDKSAKQETIYTGLFTYPCLMAADILLYQAHGVPVGEDQKQHVELTRDLAMRFNSRFGKTFVVPEPVIPAFAARVRSLADPSRKMSKSDEPHTYIALTDDAAVIQKKLRRAVTDSEGEIRYDPAQKPGVSNLLEIYAACTGKPTDAAVADFAGCGYGALKDGTAQAVIDLLTPIQQKFYAHMADQDALAALCREDAERARDLAGQTVKAVYERVGLLY